MLRFAFLAAFASVSLSALAVEATSRTLATNGVSVSVTGKGNFSIKLDGVYFSPTATFHVVKPEWKGKYYAYDDEKDLLKDALFSQQQDEVQQLVLPLGRSNPDFDATQTLQLFPDRRLRIHVEAKLKDGLSGVLEHRLGTIPPGWIIGQPWKAVFADNSTSEGRVAVAATTDDFEASAVAKNFQELNLETRLGPVKIAYQGKPVIGLHDYRLNKWAAGKEYFWFGLASAPITDETLAYEVVFSFPPAEDTDSTSPTAVGGKLVNVPDVLEAEEVTDRIIPTPKSVAWKNGTMELTSATRVELAVYPTEKHDLIHDVVNASLQRLRNRTGLPLPLERMPSRVGKAPRGTIHIAFGGSERFDSRSPLLRPVDEYGINITEVASITADTTAALSYAFDTLDQLVRFEKQSIGLRRCLISDHPEMAFRGIHFFTGKGGARLQKKMIRDILGPLKINRLLYQVDYMKWESFPQIHHPVFGMEKEEVRQVAEAAADEHIEVIPLINTFGHSEWLLDNDSMRQYADNPAVPYAYDPSNPEVYSITGKIYEEAIELFHPRVIHIGHDEVNINDFPVRESNRQVPVTDLIIRDIRHYHTFLQKRGIRTAIWGDMFIGPKEAPDATFAPSLEEAEKRRDMLPKDILVFDWHYEVAPVDAYKSLEAFNKGGFDAIACTWHDLKNITRFAKAAHNQILGQNGQTSGSTIGLCQTTWAGYSFDQTSFEENADQYAAYVLAAEAAWTGGTTEPESIPFNYRDEFVRFWTLDMLPPTSSAGWTVDLSSIANQPASGEFSWLKHLQTGHLMRLGRYGFASPEAAVVFSGKFNRTRSQLRKARLDIGTTATAIGFATGATYASPTNDTIASTEVLYEDSAVEKLEWRLGINVMAISDSRSTIMAPLAWTNPEKSLPSQHVHVYTWLNPSPEKTIKAINFSSADEGSALVLFGISGIQ